MLANPPFSHGKNGIQKFFAVCFVIWLMLPFSFLFPLERKKIQKGFGLGWGEGVRGAEGCRGEGVEKRKEGRKSIITCPADLPCRAGPSFVIVAIVHHAFCKRCYADHLA